MEEWRRKKIEDVYSKWEKKSRSQGTRPGNGYSKSRDADVKSITVRAPRYSSASSIRANRQRQKISQQADGIPNGAVHLPPAFVPSLGVPSSALHAASDLKYTTDRYCCLKCLPKSRVEYVADPDATIGLNNFLVIDRHQLGFFGRLFPFNVYLKLSRVNFRLRDLRPDILVSDRVKVAVIDCADAAVLSQGDDSGAVALQNQRKRAVDIITTMSSGVSTSVLRVIIAVVTWAFGKLFCKMQVPKKQEAMLRKAQERGVPIVYLPGHKSHMDYLLVSYVLFRMGIPIPRIAAGDNLRIPFISWLITHLGGFFIKRKLDNGKGKDVLYRKCLHEFIERSLCDGEGIEIFIEGSRSRSGKPNSPKAGLLSVVVDSVRKGVVQDVLLVPVGISYDKLIERQFVRHELMGGSKKKETFMEAMRGAWTILTARSGSVRIDFGQPFSLHEYLEKSSIADSSQLELTNMSLSRSVLNMADLAYRKVVAALGQHIVYDITQCASLMPAGIVSFLLLTKHRGGVTMEELVKSYLYIEQVASSKKRSVGFSGDVSEAVHYGLTYLESMVQVDEQMRMNGRVTCELMIKPRLELPDVFELFHYTNQVTPLLVQEAVLACALHILVGEKLRVKQFNKVKVDKDQLVEEAVQLCRILSREFIFAPPCEGLNSVMEDTVDSMVRADLLRTPPQVMNTMYPGRKLPRLQDVSDDEGERDHSSSTLLEVNTEECALEQLSFLRSILGPFLESYWHSYITILRTEQIKEELEFLTELHESLVQKASNGLLQHVESCSMDMLRNSVKSMIDLGYVSYKKNTCLHMVDPDAMVEDVLDRLASFGH